MTTIPPTVKRHINVGVVGCGHWGPNLIRSFHSLGDCVLKMVCDADCSRLVPLQALHPGIICETEFDRMLERSDIDAVVVATPAKLHFPMARASLLAGKHTLVETPMAASAEQCEELIDIARLRNLVLMVGHTSLYSEPVRKLKEVIGDQGIGDIRYIAAQRLNMGVCQQDINVAWDLSSHDIAIILHLVQELPHSVVCRGAAHNLPGIEGATSMSLRFANKREAIIRSSWHDSRKVRDMTIIGSKRMLVYDDLSTREKIKIFGARDPRPAQGRALEEFLYSYDCTDVQLPLIQDDEPLKNECQHFLESIRCGTAPLTGGAEGLEVVRILEASSESLRRGGSPVPIAAALRPKASSPPSLEKVPFGSIGATIHASVAV